MRVPLQEVILQEQHGNWKISKQITSKIFKTFSQYNLIFIFHCSPCNRPSIAIDCNINDGWYINQIKQLISIPLL